MKYAHSPAYRTSEAPLELPDAIALIGLGLIDQVTMTHSVKSLFVFQSPQLKKLFTHSWKRQILKCAIAQFLADKLKFPHRDRVVIGSLMSDIGTLSVLSAFQQQEQLPSAKIYFSLCREYSKSLGLVLLKKWQMHEYYSSIVQQCGQWSCSLDKELDALDIINLALYHTITFLSPKAKLPALEELAAYKKLTGNDNDMNGRRLVLVDNHRQEIQAMANLMK